MQIETIAPSTPDLEAIKARQRTTWATGDFGADAEDLPFGDNTFDVALSTFGVMFAPNQPRAAAELLRVVKPGGRIGLASRVLLERLDRAGKEALVVPAEYLEVVITR